MPDVFLSYNREDQAAARRFAEAFVAEGLEVWWDATLRSGEAYDEVTESALKTAKAVVVLWSPRSVVSRWVRAEATLADRNKTLLPATIEPCERPIMFELTQTADLAHWQGEPADKAWLAFLADVKRFVQSGSPAAAPATPVAATSALRQPGKLSICVLPFANMSGDAEQEYFADGITEDIITDLSKVSALSVIARNTAFTFKGRSVAIREVARELEVTHVLEGSVRKAGNRVRITAQLIDGKAGDHVWADRYDRDLDDIFALQDEIAQAIVAALKLKLLPEEKKAIEQRGTSNLEAYDIYLRAQSFTRQSGVAELERGAQLFREALALDPDFALAWTGLATALNYITVYAPAQAEAARQELALAVERALALTPDLWTTHAMHGMQQIGLRNWAAAGSALAKALELAPASEWLPVFWNGTFHFDVGRANESIGYFQTARAADPLSLNGSEQLQMALSAAGRRSETMAEYERSKDLAGDREAAENAALIYAFEGGDTGAIEAQLRRFLDFENPSVAVRAFREIAEIFDQPALVHAKLRQAAGDPANWDGPRQFKIAFWASLFGASDVALSCLRAAFVELRWYPVFAVWLAPLKDVRKDPRFKDIVRDLGLVDYWRKSGKWGDFARPAGDDDF